MKIKDLAETTFAAYGVLTAVDKLGGVVKGHKIKKMDKEVKRKYRKHRPFVDYENFVFDTKDLAYDFLELMRTQIDMEGFCTVSDMYDVKGKASTIVDTKCGWYHLYDDEVKVKKSGGKYCIRLPRPIFIKERGFIK